MVFGSTFKTIKKKDKYVLIVRSLEERADLITLFNACRLIRDLTKLKFIVVGKVTDLKLLQPEKVEFKFVMLVEFEGKVNSNKLIQPKNA